MNQINQSIWIFSVLSSFTSDYLGRQGKGESVWISMFLAFILKETVELCQFIADHKTADLYHAAYQKLRQAINDHCWNGAWYIRATNDQGEVIGSSKNEEGKIFLMFMRKMSPVPIIPLMDRRVIPGSLAPRPGCCGMGLTIFLAFVPFIVACSSIPVFLEIGNLIK